MGNNPLLQIENLQVFYGGIQAIHGISLQVEQGEIISVIGANGAGKSTLLKTIAGDKEYKAGSIKFEGNDLPSKGYQFVEKRHKLSAGGQKDFCKSDGKGQSDGRRIRGEIKRIHETVSGRGI